MRVIVREAAYDDLDRIYAWIAKDPPRAAQEVVERILESAGRLGRFPYTGHIGKAGRTYEWVVPGLPYIVVYKVDGDPNEVQITPVFHGAQDRERGRNYRARMTVLDRGDWSKVLDRGGWSNMKKACVSPDDWNRRMPP